MFRKIGSGVLAGMATWLASTWLASTWLASTCLASTAASADRASADMLLSTKTLHARFALIVSSVKPIDHRSCESRGSALYLGDDLYLTAAHVLLDRADVARECRFTPAVSTDFARSAAEADPFRVSVRRAAGATADGTVAALGSRRSGPSGEMDFAGSADFAIVRAKTAGARPALRPCAGPPHPGQTVVVVLRQGLVRTRVAATQTAKSDGDARYVDLDEVLDHGTSGAGVLDAATSCVLGLISHRWPEPTPRVTRMTPTAVFVDAWQTMIAR